MFVHQISVMLPNEPGKLAALTRLLSDNGINLLALSIADTSSFGIVRCIVADVPKVEKTLLDAGYAVRTTDVLAVCVPDAPGGLASVLELFVSEGISIEYMYSFSHNVDGKALLIFRVEAAERAAALLASHGITVLSQEQVKAL